MLAMAQQQMDGQQAQTISIGATFAVRSWNLAAEKIKTVNVKKCTKMPTGAGSDITMETELFSDFYFHQLSMTMAK